MYLTRSKESIGTMCIDAQES